MYNTWLFTTDRRAWAGYGPPCGRSCNQIIAATCLYHEFWKPQTSKPQLRVPRRVESE
jgi:hypothetical protein